jgi:hypothetical protein
MADANHLDESPEDEILDDAALNAISGGQASNSTTIVWASTFIPFDSSF